MFSDPRRNQGFDFIIFLLFLLMYDVSGVKKRAARPLFPLCLPPQTSSVEASLPPPAAHPHTSLAECGGRRPLLDYITAQWCLADTGCRGHAQLPSPSCAANFNNVDSRPRPRGKVSPPPSPTLSTGLCGSQCHCDSWSQRGQRRLLMCRTAKQPEKQPDYPSAANTPTD